MRRRSIVRFSVSASSVLIPVLLLASFSPLCVTSASSGSLRWLKLKNNTAETQRTPRFRREDPSRINDNLLQKPGVSRGWQRSPQAEAFLEDLERRSFRYFWEQADPNTGLVLDRTRTDGTPTDENHRVIASIAATGFALTALCIASERRWITRAAARQRVRNTLLFFSERALHEHGWFYHWMDFRNGDRKWKSEISSIDTALLLAGILTAKQYFREDAAIVRFATKIYERIDFPWMLNGHPTLLSMGWHPETGFIKARWDNYSEHPILYLMAIGSPTHPLRPDSWYAWERNWNEYRGYKYLGKTPLFTYQYSHAWVDFRNRREDRNEKIDYFRNSVDATLAHRLFCMELATEFPAYGPDMWGISASDSIKGYVAWGGPPRDPAIDGTVVPYVPAGSLMFVPELGLSALQNMRRKHGNKIYGKYGFTDAFNPNTGWVNPDVIGIDLGMTILGAENARTQNVWRWFMRNPEITKAMDLIGLRSYTRTRGYQTIGDQVGGPDRFRPGSLRLRLKETPGDIVGNQILILPNLQVGGSGSRYSAENHFNGLRMTLTLPRLFPFHFPMCTRRSLYCEPTGSSWQGTYSEEYPMFCLSGVWLGLTSDGNH